MGCTITQSVVDQAAVELAEMFKNRAGKMQEAWERTAGNLTVSMSCVWKPSDDNNAIQADIGIKFKLSEVAEKSTFIFADGYGPLFEGWQPPDRTPAAGDPGADPLAIADSPKQIGHDGEVVDADFDVTEGES